MRGGVQAALASLVPSKGAAAPGVPSAALAQQVADALRRALGVQEPRLIGLLRVRSATSVLRTPGRGWLLTPINKPSILSALEPA